MNCTPDPADDVLGEEDGAEVLQIHWEVVGEAEHRKAIGKTKFP